MKDLEMIKFCDFLDQQKEYKLADAIIGNLNKTAMNKTHHTEDVSFDKILDLTIKYSQANPKSFMRLAAGPEIDPIKTFVFLEKLGFKYEDFLKDIPWSEVNRRYEAYKSTTKSDPGDLTLRKLYATAHSDGGQLLIDKGIVAKMRTMASTVRTLSDTPAETPSDIVNKAGKSSLATGAAAASKNSKLWSSFVAKLGQMFPRFSSGLSKFRNIQMPLLTLIFSIDQAMYWIPKITNEGWDALNSVQEVTGFSAFISLAASTISAGIALVSAAPTEGVGLMTAGSLAAILLEISIVLGGISTVAGWFEKDKPSSKKPSSSEPASKPATLPTKPSNTQSPKPVTSPTKPEAAPKKPSSKPSTMDKKTEEAFQSLRFKK